MNSRKKSRRALLISYYAYPPFSYGGGRRVFFFKKYLEEHNYQCDIISADRISLNGERLLNRANTVKTRRRFRFLRKYNIFPDTMIMWGIRVWNTVKRIHSRYDRIIISAPPFSLLIFFSLNRYLSSRIEIDMRDVWAGGALQEYGGWFLYFLDRQYEAFSIKRFKYIYAATEGISKILKHRHNIHADTIYNMIDFNEAGDCNVTESNTIIYTGKIDRLRNNDNFFKIMSEMDDIKLKFAGDDLENVLPHNTINEGILNRAEMLKSICRSAAGVILISFEAENEENIFTSKIFDYMLMKKPILYIGPHCEASHFIHKHAIGITVTENNRDAVEKGIRDIIHYETHYSDNMLRGFDFRNMCAKLMSR